MSMVASTEQIIKRFKEQNRNFEINIGASVVLLYNGGIIFSLVKPTYWRTEAHGLLVIDYSGIGGSVKKNETPYQCAVREIYEEIGISEKNLRLPNKSGNLLYIKDKKRQFMTVSAKTKEPAPLCIYEIKVSKRYDRPNQSARSCLLLFVYLVKLEGNKMPHIRKSEDIPGLVNVKGTFLNEFLKGVKVEFDAEPSPRNYSLHIRAKYKKLLPQTFILSPKFTPQAILSSGLKYKDFIRYYSVA